MRVRATDRRSSGKAVSPQAHLKTGFLCVACLSWNCLCRLGWPRTQSAGIKGMGHHHHHCHHGLQQFLLTAEPSLQSVTFFPLCLSMAVELTIPARLADQCNLDCPPGPGITDSCRHTEHMWVQGIQTPDFVLLYKAHYVCAISPVFLLTLYCFLWASPNSPFLTCTIRDPRHFRTLFPFLGF